MLAAQAKLISGQADLIKDFVSVQKSLGRGWQSAALKSAEAGQKKIETPY